MNIKKQKFLITFLVTLIISIIVVVIIDNYFGSIYSGLVLFLLSPLYIKYFQKIDLKPTISLKFPNTFKEMIYPTFISILLFVGCINIVMGLLQYFVIFFGDEVFCNIPFLVSVVILDWGTYIIIGLLIGKLYPQRALTLSYIGVFVSFVVLYPQIYLENTFEKLTCLFDSLLDEDLNDSSVSGIKFGTFVGFIIRGYVTIFFAKFSSNKSLKIS